MLPVVLTEIALQVPFFLPKTQQRVENVSIILSGNREITTFDFRLFSEHCIFIFFHETNLMHAMDRKLCHFVTTKYSVKFW